MFLPVLDTDALDALGLRPVALQDKKRCRTDNT